MIGFQSPQMRLGVIHIVGIAGIGMSGLAEILHSMGCVVQGSDLSVNENTKRLQAKGITTYKGHMASNIEGAQYVVISSAIAQENVEVVAAKKHSIPVIKRSALLASIVATKDTIAISGAHGKTTTTSIVASMLEKLGASPTVINGGIINQHGTNAYLGDGDYMVVEADESDGTFVQIPSKIVVVTNIDREHMDYYGDFDNLLNHYRTFITSIPFYGFAVLCGDHPDVLRLSQEVENREIILYGFANKDCHILGQNIRFDAHGAIFDVAVNLPKQSSYVIRDITLPTMAKHNVLNSLAAISIAIKMGFDENKVRSCLSDFKGVKRRFTLKGNYNGAQIIDDYAHHPVEIKATLETARRVADQNGGRVIAIFQPHRYSRSQDLFGDFQSCYKNADKMLIADIYPAGEKPIAGVSKETMVQGAKHTNPELDIEVLEHEEQISGIIRAEAKNGDVIIFMGAGTITYWAEQVANELKG